MNKIALAPKPFGPIPSARQLLWHQREFYGFLHFTTNTFTDKEWGYGDESPEIFNPTDFDADQIASVAVQAGMRGLILTCKHHDGFCLWPSKYTDHSVKFSSWRGGKGDVVGDISEACKKYKLGFGVYLSPWDRNHPDYGTLAYIDYYRNQLHELTTQYGELFEVWFDGANGGDGFYGGANEVRSIDRQSYYDWEHTWRIVRENQPKAVIFSDAGPDVRWVGNEHGIAGNPCWSTIRKDVLFPGIDDGTFKTRLQSDLVAAWDSPTALLNAGDRRGDIWMPAECDVSIRPGWFYHSQEDDKVRDPENLLDLYFKSVGRGASFLLNVPPDRRGRLHENDVQSLLAFKKRFDTIFGYNLAQKAECVASNTRANHQAFSPACVIDQNPETFWATDDDVNQAELELHFTNLITLNIVGLREYLPLGQRVDCFAIDIDEAGQWREWVSEQAIGSQRLIKGETCMTTKIRLRIIKSVACPAIAEVGLFLDRG